MITLNYIDLSENEEESFHNNLQSMAEEMWRRTLDKKNVIFLFTWEDNNVPYDYNFELLVTDHMAVITLILEHISDELAEHMTFFLQEYSSFEDAYAVALDIREVHPLCYSKQSEIN